MNQFSQDDDPPVENTITISVKGARRPETTVVMLVPFSAKTSFGQAAKRLKERYFSFECSDSTTGTRTLEVRVEQQWKDDGKGGTEIGFGACVYPGAYVLAEFLCSNPQLVRGKSVLELGSGTGIVSIVCAKLGCSRVIATDGDTASVALSAKNLAKNGFAGREDAQSVRYLWGDATEDLGELDVVVASDIVACPYVDHFGELQKSLRDLFELNGVSRMLLVYERRAEVEEKFFEELEQFGIEKEEETLQSSDFRDSKIQLFTLKKMKRSDTVTR